MKKLLISLLILPIFSYSSNLVLTNNQVNYTITKNLTKDTNIEVKDVFNTGSNMRANQYKELSKMDLSEFKEAIAVITLDKVWDEDSLFEHIRRENIRIINIDATYSYSDNTSLVISTKKYNSNLAKINPYVWLNLYNLQKMYKIVAMDLAKIFESDKDKILENLDKNLKKIDNLIKEYSSIELDSAILLTEDIEYLAGFLNIYSINKDYDDITKDNILNILNDEQIDVIMTSKPLKRDIVKILNKNNKKYILINTGAYPLEDDDDEDLMKEDGLDIYLLDNLKNLKGE
ncbi:metal ABC transporter solute-binding protein, Zn/Mn family [Oceanivirga miroungae]|uniref:Periplasmic solute binding protein n=1 Tax=Oceanivirga miroungae TaxID=1130046 RepID=A0A6I8M7S4_9FUSO|nr:hypothetical protein [Oceanivirga miroungae]VWL85540.1 hypothetical protein OMES3154_00826 [Oceanivirga miroungae]